MRHLLLFASTLLFTALSHGDHHGHTAHAQEAASLGDILAAQPDEVKARYPYRNPEQTLAFFGIEPGMTVVEALPGGGWYSKILLPALGPEGKLVGANYPANIWPLFGFISAERIAELATWTTDWTAIAEGWRDRHSAQVDAVLFGSIPEEMAGSADAILFIRAMHNLARFEDQGGFLTQAIADAHKVLKPGGIAGIVQHAARDEMSDAWANGSRGYLKPAFVIQSMEAAGFIYESESDINANPKDQHGEEDIVWRLPPSLMGSRDKPEAAAAMRAIGESNRMTLKFRKPAP